MLSLHLRLPLLLCSLLLLAATCLTRTTSSTSKDVNIHETSPSLAFALMLKPWLLSIFLLVAVTSHAAHPEVDPSWFGPELPDSFAHAHNVDPLATEMESILDFPHGQLQPAYLYSPQAHLQSVAGHLQSPTTRFFEVHGGGRGRVPIYASPVFTARLGQRPTLGLMFFKMERMGKERVITPTFLTGVRPDYLAHRAMYPWQYLHERATLTLPDLVRRLGPLHTNLV